MNSRAVTFLAERFASGLIHPGNAQQKPFAVLPGLREAGMSEEMKQQFAADAKLPSVDTGKLFGEAVVHSLTTDGGFTIIDTAKREAELAELERLRELVDGGPGKAKVYDWPCDCHGKTWLQVTLGKDGLLPANLRLIAKAVEHHGGDQ